LKSTYYISEKKKKKLFKKYWTEFTCYSHC